MPDLPQQITQIQPTTNPITALENYNLPKRESISVEYQKWTTDEEPLKLYFYYRLCGWILVTKSRKYVFLGEEREELYEKLEINKEFRLCNESLASRLYYDISPLISKLTTTSILNKEGIYKSWNSQMITKVLMLSRSARFDGNPYEINPNAIPEIITFLCSFSNMTKKALDGFTTKFNTQSMQTATLIRSGFEPQSQKNEGLLDKINIFKK